jgi:hypothetical protein
MWKKMQAIGDIISYFFSYYFNCHTKKSTKIQLGEIYDIRPCNNSSTFTVYWGENMTRGKSHHIFPVGHNLFFVTVSAYFNWGKLYDFFPLCLYFFPPRPFN